MDSPNKLLLEANKLKKLLEKKKKNLVFIESCTGGLLSSTYCSLPGASKTLAGSLVVYQTKSKHQWLGIPSSQTKSGDVSEKVSYELAKNGLKKTPHANLCVSITGHLGPNAPRQLDGMIYVCVAIKSSIHKKTQFFQQSFTLPKKSRTQRQILSSTLVYSMVRSLLQPDINY